MADEMDQQEAARLHQVVMTGVNRALDLGADQWTTEQRRRYLVERKLLEALVVAAIDRSEVAEAEGLAALGIDAPALAAVRDRMRGAAAVAVRAMATRRA